MQEFTLTYSPDQPLIIPPSVQKQVEKGASYQVIFRMESPSIRETKGTADADAALLAVVEKIQARKSEPSLIIPAEKKMTDDDVERLLAMKPDEEIDWQEQDKLWAAIEAEMKAASLADSEKTLRQMEDEFFSTRH